MAISLKKPMINSLFQKQIPTNKKIKFLRMLGQLLGQGFSMKEALPFLQIVIDQEGNWILSVLEELSNGCRLDQALKAFDFPDFILSQIYFAYQQGKLDQALLKTAEQLQAEEDRKKELQSLLTYPFFLLIFMVGIILAMRFLLLPKMIAMIGESDLVTRLAIAFIEYSPFLFLLMILILFFAILYLRNYRKRKSAFAVADLLVSIPLIGHLIRHFYSYRFSKEWAGLLASGLSMKHIVTIMQQEESSQLLKEMGEHLENGLLSGLTVAQIIGQLSFFDTELSLIVLHGQKIGNLADSLSLYADQTLQTLNEKNKKIFQYIQPFMFILIAILIVIIYGAMLLPMFSFMNQL